MLSDIYSFDQILLSVEYKTRTNFILKFDKWTNSYFEKNFKISLPIKYCLLGRACQIAYNLKQRKLTYFVRGSIIVLLTSCFTILDEAFSLYQIIYRFDGLVECKQVKQNVSHAVILPLLKKVSKLWLVYSATPKTLFSYLSVQEIMARFSVKFWSFATTI